MISNSGAEHIVQRSSLQEIQRNHPHFSRVLEVLFQPQAPQIGNRVDSSLLLFQKSIKAFVSYPLILQKPPDFFLILLYESDNCLPKIFRDILCIVFNFPGRLFLFFLEGKCARFSASADFMKLVGRTWLYFAVLLGLLMHSFLQVGVYLNFPN